MLAIANLSEKDRSLILAAASHCIRVHGFKDTSVEMIARQAGVSSATMRRCFATMEMVVAGLAIRHLEAVDADINALGPDPDTMAIVDALVDRAREWTANGDAALFFIFLAEAERNPLVGQVLGKGLYLCTGSTRRIDIPAATARSDHWADRPAGDRHADLDNLARVADRQASQFGS